MRAEDNLSCWQIQNPICARADGYFHAVWEMVVPVMWPTLLPMRHTAQEGLDFTMGDGIQHEGVKRTIYTVSQMLKYTRKACCLQHFCVNKSVLNPH